jgi:hypothetical protein
VGVVSDHPAMSYHCERGVVSQHSTHLLFALPCSPRAFALVGETIRVVSDHPAMSPLSRVYYSTTVRGGSLSALYPPPRMSPLRSFSLCGREADSALLLLLIM